MKKKIERGISWAFAVFSILISFIPDELFSCIHIWNEELSVNSSLYLLTYLDGINILLIKLLFFAMIFVICFTFSCIYSQIKKVKINGDNYTIIIEYGNILEKKKCQRIISFDECYTTKIGTYPSEIKKDSICGQYLLKYPNLNIHALIKQGNIDSCKRKSKYQNFTCYEPGTIVPNGDDLLMAFVRLDENGKSMKFTVEEYLQCLSLLWKEIDNNYNNKDVCVPVLGAGLARFENGTSQSLSQQELVDLIVSSYKLSPNKIKSKNSLHIVCSRRDDFSMDKVA